MKNRIISIILTLAIVVGMVPMLEIGVRAKMASDMTEAEAFKAGLDVYMAWYNHKNSSGKIADDPIDAMLEDENSVFNRLFNKRYPDGPAEGGVLESAEKWLQDLYNGVDEFSQAESEIVMTLLLLCMLYEGGTLNSIEADTNMFEEACAGFVEAGGVAFDLITYDVTSELMTRTFQYSYNYPNEMEMLWDWYDDFEFDKTDMAFGILTDIAFGIIDEETDRLEAIERAAKYDSIKNASADDIDILREFENHGFIGEYVKTYTEAYDSIIATGESGLQEKLLREEVNYTDFLLDLAFTGAENGAKYLAGKTVGIAKDLSLILANILFGLEGFNVLEGAWKYGGDFLFGVADMKRCDLSLFYLDWIRNIFSHGYNDAYYDFESNPTPETAKRLNTYSRLMYRIYSASEMYASQINDTYATAGILNGEWMHYIPGGVDPKLTELGVAQSKYIWTMRENYLGGALKSYTEFYKNNVYQISLHMNDGVFPVTEALGWSQTVSVIEKVKSINETIPAGIPVRDFFKFKGWSTDPDAKDGDPDYAPGKTYSEDADLTLYAIWERDPSAVGPNDYVVTYNANGGKGAPEAQAEERGTPLTLRSDIPTRAGYTFMGWSINENGRADYAAGATYSENTDITLYAVWNKGPAAHTHSWKDTRNENTVTFTCESCGATKKITIDETITGYGVCGDNMTWTRDDEYTLRIVGRGDMYNYSANRYAPWGTGVQSIIIDSRVTSIGDYAFASCSRMGTIRIGSRVKSIGRNAFYGCNGLTSVIIPRGVTSIESAAFADCANLKSISIGDTVKRIGEGAFNGCKRLVSVIIPNSATIIDDRAFFYCSALESVTIGSGVTSIGEDAFYGCTALTRVTIPRSVTNICESAFNYCTGLAEVNMGKNVKSIGPFAFCDCHSLTSLTVPESVENIGNYAFNSCYSLTQINWNAKNAVIGEKVFNVAGSRGDGMAIVFGDSVERLPIKATGSMERSKIKSVVIGNGIITIDSYAFSGCTNLASVIISPSVTSIGSYAFNDCDSLVGITIPNSVTSIGDHAFYYCSALKSITIPDSVTSIGDSAFHYCTNLENVHIGKNVRNIGAFAFGNCTSLTSLTVPESVSNIGDYAFNSCYGLTQINWNAKNAVIGEKVFNVAGSRGDGMAIVFGDSVERLPIKATGSMERSKIKSVVIGNGITTIDSYAFSGCTNLASVIISPSVTSIGSYAFNDCDSLVGITIPNSVTSIGDHAFYYSGLTGITIPDSVTSIGDSAFYYCTNLENVHIGKNVRNIGVLAFGSCTSLTSLTVPESVSNIGNYAFNSCYGLTQINWNAKNAVIGETVFNGAGSRGDGIALVFGDSVERLPIKAIGSMERTKIKSVVIGSGITTIDSYAFSGYTALLEIEVPDTVTAIGDYAFNNCTAITRVTIGNGVKTIGNSAFYYCKSLEEVNIHSRDVTFGTNPFHYTSADLEIHGYAGSTTESYAASKGHTFVPVDEREVIASGECGDITWKITTDCEMTIAGEGALTDITANTPWREHSDIIATVAIGEDVAHIDNIAFFNCKNLTAINVDADNPSYTSIAGVLYTKDDAIVCYPAGKTDIAYAIPDGTTAITGYTFRACENLASVTIPDSVTTIGNYAFWGCEDIESITLGKGVSEIGVWTFAYCGSLSEITVDADNENYISVDGVLYTKDMKTLVAYPASKLGDTYIIPEGVTGITNYAFAGCTNLVNVTIPASMNTIGNCVFDDCPKLTAINAADGNKRYTAIDGVLYTEDMTMLLHYPAGKTDTEFTVPEAVTEIGRYAFADCDNLVNVNVGTNVTSIGYMAFAYCDRLANISYAGTEAEWDFIQKGSYWNRYLDGDEVKLGA